jgi:hypothetical protein
MSTIEVAQRISVSALVVLATFLLGMGEHDFSLFVASVVIAAVSAYVTDFRGWFYLRQRYADLLAVSAIAISAVQAAGVDRPGQMFVMAHLQSYLQFVLMFQPKGNRLYWQLALLSFGQVAIASTLLSGPTFALLTVVYLFLGVFTFALLVLATDAKARQGVGPRLDVSVAGVGNQPVLYSNTANVEPRDLISGMLRQCGLVSAISVAVSIVLFFVLPRWDVPQREIASSEPLRTVGFTKKVTLGELGEIINNADVVMRVSFFHGRESRPFKLADEPLFRGTIVSHYESGAWTQAERKTPTLMPTEIRTPFTRQKITVEPLDVAEMFCVFPVFAFQPDHRLRADVATEELTRQEDYRGRQIEFEIGTDGILDERLRRIVPHEHTMYRSELREMLQMPTAGPDKPDSLAGLRATAARVLEQRGVDPADRVAAARALNDYLSSSGNYLYSLDAQQRNLNVDPLEDFVTTHRLGHCEYFAGALAMMLRSQGIPARMAIGYKGGEWNPLGMYYQVQQLHAHAWVEVYLRRDDIPPDEFAADEIPPGAWLVLDPTEGTQESSTALGGGRFLARVWQYIDYGQVLWTNYVVGLNFKRQRQGIYEPLAQGVSAAVDNIISPQIWQDRLRAVSNSPVGTFWQWYRRHWFDWRGGLVAAGFCMLSLTVYLSARALIALLRRLGLAGMGRADGPPVLEMYRRLERALAARGFQRLPGQTAHEFAVAAGGQLAEDSRHRPIAHLPRRIIDVFHRVRFGGRTLDNVEAESLEHALSELERTLAPSS